MRVTVIHFGVLRDLLGEKSRLLELAEGATVRDVLRVSSSASNESGIWKALAVAVNREYAGMDTLLKDGDEVALLPPVSGGRDEA
jgi:molybdopterin converting factor small subunit